MLRIVNLGNCYKCIETAETDSVVFYLLACVCHLYGLLVAA